MARSGPLIKWRDGAQKKDAELDARIEALIALQERQAKAAVAPAKPEGPVGPDRKIEVEKEDRLSGRGGDRDPGRTGGRRHFLFADQKENDLTKVQEPHGLRTLNL